MGHLQTLGLGAEEEIVYQELVGLGKARESVLSERTGLALPVVRQALQQLGARGLVTSARESSETAHRALPPGVTLLALLAQARERLTATEGAITELASRFPSTTNQDLESAGWVPLPAAAVHERVAEMIHSARSEVRITHRAPSLANDPQVRAAVTDAGDRGVLVRAIYDASALESDSLWSWVRSASHPERRRTLPSAPFASVVRDAESGVLAVEASADVVTRAMLTPAGELLHGLLELFEVLWGLGVPFDVARPLEDPLGGHGPSLAEREMLALVASGLKDEAAAARLGISPRTLRRRLGATMATLGATNRLQAGYLAAKRGWFSQPAR